MAQFHVGQRVKKVAQWHGPAVRVRRYTDVPLGATGTIVGPDPDGEYEWMVDYDGVSPRWRDHCYANSYMLVPLTDPAADAFIESIKRLKPYEEPKVETVKVRV